MTAEPTSPTRPPGLAGLDVATREAAAFLDRAARARGAAWVNAEGGDVGAHGSLRSVVRHVGHYLAAVELGQARGVAIAGAALLDVGSGVGALAAWAADRLGMALHLADHHTAVLAVATTAFPEATVVADLGARAGWAPLVTAMEVVEHLPPSEHEAFAALLWRQVAPGGLLVVSTPEETRYPGGWSGYAPHVGCVDAPGLRRLLEHASGQPASVWRLEGAPWALPRHRAWLESGLNRAWSLLHDRLPAVADRLGSGAARIAPSYAHMVDGAIPTDVAAVPPSEGTGTGLLGVVARPGSSAPGPRGGRAA